MKLNADSHYTSKLPLHMSINKVRNHRQFLLRNNVVFFNSILHIN
jgi:hypothetical protein